MSDDTSADPLLTPGSLIRPHGSSNATPGVETPRNGTPDSIPDDTSALVVTDFTPSQAPVSHPVQTSPLASYIQQPFSKLPAPDSAGLRTFNGKHFVDVEGEGTDNRRQTVMVGFDKRFDTYRAKFPHELEPSGPPLYPSGKENIWSLNKPFTYLDSNQYSVAHLPNAQGYYPVRNANSRIDDPVIGFAFRDEHKRRWVLVDPAQAGSDTSAPVNLAQWTDGEIWNMYRIHGAETLQFRAEAQATGHPPQWVTRFKEPNVHLHATESLKWRYPDKSFAERAELLRSYNMTATQQAKFSQDLESGQIPEWTEQHKRLTLDKDNAQRFKLIAEELEPYIISLRNGRDDYALYPEDSYSREFLDDYLKHAGYQRNVHDALYRTDIPAMFRGETRTPFELARDGRMIHRRGNPSGTTTKKALSATFSLGNAVTYASSMGGYWHELDYNSQANRYPGQHSGQDHSDGARDDSVADSDSSFVLDYSKDYPSARRNQRKSFIYAIDTRDIEIVPGAENDKFNSIHDTTEFDPMEGRISMPTRGISAERIWLVKSDLSRAARVEDVRAQAGADGDDLEQATWEGKYLGTGTRREFDTATGMMRYVDPDRYDDLIDQVAASGTVVLELPKGKESIANDIVWPVPAHYRP